MNRNNEDIETFPQIYKRSKNKRFSHSKQYSKRLMNKSGHLNMQLSHVPYYKYLRFTKDFANTLVQIRWRWVTLIVVLANAFFYVFFAGMWMLDAWLSGDFNSTKKEGFCIESTKTFTGYLLLSIETITTTGYGYLYPTEHCQFALVTLTLSTMVMILIDGAFISVVFLKVFKPLRKDALTIISKKAVVRKIHPGFHFSQLPYQICLRNGKLCLIFRIYDKLNKHTIEPTVACYFIERTITQKNTIEAYLHEIEIKPFGMLLWPSDIVHEINEESPFWELTASDIMNRRFEIFVTVTGSSLVTDQFSTSQTSFLNEEILWGYRFQSCMEYDEKLGSYKIDEHNLFKIMPCDTPLCSASKLKKIKYELQLNARVNR